MRELGKTAVCPVLVFVKEGWWKTAVCPVFVFVDDEIKKYCRGRNSKSIRTALNYFIKNRKRMAYANATTAHLPIDGGAVESAVRHVVNLRMNGSAIFWCKSNAEHLEHLLMLHSYYKSGRWEQFKKMAFSPLATIANLA